MPVMSVPGGGGAAMVGGGAPPSAGGIIGVVAMVGGGRYFQRYLFCLFIMSYVLFLELN